MEEAIDKTTTAKLRKGTIKRLKSLLGKKKVEKNESVDDCVSRLLDFYETAHPEHPMPAEAS